MTWQRWLRRMPWPLLACSLLLVAAGLVAIRRVEELADLEGLVARQAVWAVVSLAAALAVTWPTYRVLSRSSYALLAACTLLLVAVYFFPPINGARRWLRVGPVGLQPAEFAKLAVVLALARYLMHRDNFRRLPGLLWPLAVTLLPVVLILREPDLGTALVFLPVLLAMVFTAGARKRDLAVLLGTGVCLLPLLWQQMSTEQRSRVTALFEQTGPQETPSDDGFQLHQAKQLVALGDWWGSWVTGNWADDPGAYRLPAAHTDFVLAVWGERTGVLGSLLLMALYVVLVWQMLVVARCSREPFGRLVAVGVAALFAVQVLINTAMTVGLAPVTGLSLPLVSYGGSGLLAHSLAVGLVLNIAMRPGYEVSAEPFRHRVRA